MTDLLEILGHFHILLLHLPIGILVYAFAHYMYDRFWGIATKRVDLSFALTLGVISACAAAITGLLLANKGSYEGDVLSYHKWLGISTAVFSIVLLAFYRRHHMTNLYMFMFAGLMLLLGLTGHYGGTITHGENFLTSTSNKMVSTALVTNIDEANVYQDMIMPIIKSKCVSCHNPSKIKGDLLLHDKAGWIAGGKLGKPLVVGNLAASLIHKRIHLPKSEKEHMPPNGKKQLTTEELKLMDWWMENMESYEQKFADLSPPDNIKIIVKALFSGPKSNVKKADYQNVQILKEAGYEVLSTGKDSPFLEVAFTNKSNITNSQLSKLKSIKDQLLKLNLSGTNITDKQISKLPEFKNITNLNLSKTSISSKALKSISNLESLQVLNIYGTKVDNDIWKHMAKLSNLKKLYIWHTDILPEDIPKNLKETIDINIGDNSDMFKKIKLGAPSILAANDLFSDSIIVTLATNANEAIIKYSLDGQELTTDALSYKEPIVLRQSTVIKAITTKENWEESVPVSKSFIKIEYQPLEISLSPTPHEKYNAGGNTKALIDFVKASNQFSDKGWLGWEGKDVTLVLDMGKVIPITTVSIGSLQDNLSYIFLPKGIKVSTSENGKTYDQVASKTMQTNKGLEDIQVKNYISTFDSVNAQYVKVQISSQIKNPDWHPAPGAPSWLFLDEVIVE